MPNFLSYSQQVEQFETHLDSIDMDLREAGVDLVIAEVGVDVSVGRLVVARSFLYTNPEADIFQDLDPLAARLGVYTEVGILSEIGRGKQWHLCQVAESLDGVQTEVVGVGRTLSKLQLELITNSVNSLRIAKTSGGLTMLTKSYRKIDPAGD